MKMFQTCNKILEIKLNRKMKTWWNFEQSYNSLSNIFTFQQWRVHQACIGSVENRSVLWKLGSEMVSQIRMWWMLSRVKLSSSLRPWEHLEDHADDDEHDPEHSQDPDGDWVNKEGEGAPLGILPAGHGGFHPVRHNQEPAPKHNLTLIM